MGEGPRGGPQYLGRLHDTPGPSSIVVPMDRVDTALLLSCNVAGPLSLGADGALESPPPATTLGSLTGYKHLLVFTIRRLVRVPTTLPDTNQAKKGNLRTRPRLTPHPTHHLPTSTCTPPTTTNHNRPDAPPSPTPTTGLMDVSHQRARPLALRR